MAHWYMRKLFSLERKVASTMRPLARGLLSIPVPDEKVFNSVRDLFHRLEKMKGILIDQETASVRLVVNAEKMVIKEAQPTFTYLNLYGYFTDIIVCNRLITDEVDDDFFKVWKEA